MVGTRHSWKLTTAFVLALALRGTANAELLYQENFEGDDSGYDIGDESYFPPTPSEGGVDTSWSPGVWGLNTIADQIGLVQNAPARRAAILWDHTAFSDDFAREPRDVDLVNRLGDWHYRSRARADKRIGFWGGYLEESVDLVRESLVGAGYTDGNIVELLAPEDIDPDNPELDLVIHSSALVSTEFSGLKVPVISFSASDHDDSGIAGIGQATTFDDAISLQVPTEFRDHPALGAAGADGTIEWTVQGPTTLQGIGKTHNGGKAIALVEDPTTESLVPAIFVIEEGAPLLGAFNPDPEGDQYIVASALNKHGDMLERILELDPIDVSGQTDLKMTVALAATAADFENSDYLIIEADPDGPGPQGFATIAEFYGVDETHDPTNDSGCLKGLSNGFEPGAVGDICLPADEFGNYTFDLPEGSTNLVLSFRLLSTWGNEIVGIDNIRVHTGDLVPTVPGDFNSDGVLDAMDIDDLTTQVATGNNPAGYDLTGDSVVDINDINSWVKDAFNSWIGDANLDGEFNSGDLVTVLSSGTYEADVDAVWSTGDFNGDGRANTSDLVAALSDGGYEVGPRAAVAAVPEPASGLLLLLAGLWLPQVLRRRR